MKEFPERKTSETEKRDVMTKELQRHYKTLKIKPEATPEEVRQAYRYLANAWDVNRFPGNPDWRKRAEAKRAELSSAYEQILDAMNRGLDDTAGEIPLNAGDPETPPPEKENRSLSVKKIKTILLSAAAAVLFGIFVWPTAYDQDRMRSGDRIYSIRTNRITGQIFYLDSGQWKPGPVPQVRKIPDVKVFPEKVGSDVPEKAPAAPEPPAAAEKKTDQKTEKTEPARPSAPPVEKREARPAAQAKAEKKPYAVQITAIRDGERARTIVAQLKRSGFDAHMAKAAVKDQGVLYRILVGHFATREEAFTYMTGRKIKDQYPGSFVQKTIP